MFPHSVLSCFSKISDSKNAEQSEESAYVIYNQYLPITILRKEFTNKSQYVTLFCYAL